MKISKCPLCGKDPETQYYSEEEGHDEFWITGCPDCDLFSGITAVSKKNSQADWNNLVSKFPPIMRVQVGDKIIRNGGRAYRIKETDLKDMSLFVVNIDDERDGRWLNQDKVALWPWELEQEGGNEQ